jgi:ATP-dependent helicase HrpA
MAVDVGELRRRLERVTLADAYRLGRRIDGVRRQRDLSRRASALEGIAKDLDRGEARLLQRLAAVPVVSYPDELPISGRRDDIAAAIRDHQVVVVAGETGSGKTTQLPKICLDLGRGVRGLIGHTQPRRIAARTVAERLANELDVPLGAAVGYAVRFADQVGDSTLVKVMTDGILLAEIQRDRDLRRYDTIILDEAHERSLNIDFLLGYLTRLLPKRPDLKLIITSATIDPQRFAEHFGGAPIIEVSGRTYPVEVRYRPLVDLDKPKDEPRDQTEAVCEAVMELEDEGPGDILVFLSGEREIRDTADALNDLRLRDTEVLPLYARLSIAEQHRVFQPHPGRRVVLATNVAETSLTVPGVRYVVDAGTARISRYSARTKVQRLPIEPISQASAHQRAGRCGRVADGICIRLYSEDDYNGRPAFTEPEIQRTSLAAVILQMAALGLGEIERFPFVDPPDRRQIRDGLALLTELGALGNTAGTSDSKAPRLTAVGRRLAQLPLDPRLGRMILAADEGGCVREVVIIVAALSIQDPRERPLDKQQAADEQHARFADPGSDFLAYLNLWTYLREQQKALSSSAFRRMCHREFLHYLRIREWQDVVAQLRQALAAIGIAVTSSPTERDRIHQSLLVGLLSHIGLKDAARGDYQGARGARFAINPGSALFKSRPDWIMAGELVETTRLWARVCAKVDPAWAERAGAHLLVRNYSEPRWSAKQGAAIADERVTLYGVPLVAARPVQYARIDPTHARELFLRHALVQGEWRTHHRFWHANQDLIAELEDLENRARRRDIVADEDVIFDFYDERVPEFVVTTRHFDSWWKNAQREDPDRLTLTPEVLLDTDDQLPAAAAFPATWSVGSHDLVVTYAFEPGAANDGVTVHVPLTLLNQVDETPFTWQVPGLREELATALVRALPKALRRNLVPAPDRARLALGTLQVDPTRSFPAALARALTQMTGVVVPADAWEWERVPAHLRITFSVEDESGRALATGKDLAALRRAVGVELEQMVARVGSNLERDGLRAWDFDALPRVVEATIGGHVVRGFPTLVDRGDSVSVRVVGSAAEQASSMRGGVRRLLLFGAPSPARLAATALDTRAKFAITHNPHGSVARLLDDCVAAAVDALVGEGGGLPWDAAAFERLQAYVSPKIAPTAREVIRVVAEILGTVQQIEVRVSALQAPTVARNVADARAQLGGLIYDGFVAATGRDRLRHLVRYLRALDHRLDVLPNDPARDLSNVTRVHAVADVYEKARAAAADDPAASAALDDVRWMLEELRVSLFAQRLGTPQPVSEKRILRALDAARAV